MTQDREGLRALVFANPTGILITGDSKDPRERVLDAPVLPDRLGEPHALRWQGREKIPRLDLHPVPTSRRASTIPTLCTLDHEPFAPSDSISDVIQYRRVARRP